MSRGNDRILETHRRDIVVRVLRPARLHLLRRDRRARGSDGRCCANIMARWGRWSRQCEGHARPFLRRRHHGVLQRSAAVPRPGRARGRNGGRDARGRCRSADRWRRRGREIGFGIGIAQGYATLGQIGFAERIDYTAIGTVCNLAARLCAAAEDGQILISRRIATAIEASMTGSNTSAISPLKGSAKPSPSTTSPMRRHRDNLSAPSLAGSLRSSS